MSSAHARSSPQVSQVTGNVRDAALLGASTAFSKPNVKPKPQVNTYTGGSNGALLAATKVGTGALQGNMSPMRRDPSPMHSMNKTGNSSTLGVPEDHLSDRTPSPSNIAAKIAAARYSPMKSMPQSAAAPATNEREMDERDVLPPVGSVSKVLARLDSSAATATATVTATATATTTKPSSPRQRTDAGSLHSVASIASASAPNCDSTTDDTPIPPTTALVKLFEQPAKPLAVSQTASPPVRSPKPQRKILLLPKLKQGYENTEPTKPQAPPPTKSNPKPQLDQSQADELQDYDSFSQLRRDSLGAPPTRQKPAQLTAIKTTTIRPKPPPKRASKQSRPQSEDFTPPSSIRRRVSTSMDSNENASSPSSFVSAREEQAFEEEKPKLKPTLPAPRRSAKATSEIVNTEARLQTSPLPRKTTSPSNMISPLQIPEKLAPRHFASDIGYSSPSDTIYHSNYQRESAKQITRHMTGESLSNALVGAALASSRNVSPAPPPTTTPVPIRRQHHSPLHRSPSPPKQPGKLRSTLRKDPSSSSDEDESDKYKRKGTRVMGMRRKHPNKHHEGTRKRWRDAVTERERKRYEGVWAANKGLYIDWQEPTEDGPPVEVLNIVTKDIWTRSRLPAHVLEEVWDLVDGRGLGRLKREEFVVGLWLIDQRLKGRKLPVRVSDSVWASVRGVGVSVKVRPHK